MKEQPWKAERSFIRYELWQITYAGWDGIASRRYRENGKLIKFWTKKSAKRKADQLNKELGL